ncbi:FAD-dependent oxidoreductase [Paenibacillus roseipurpureus]|uniref:FAD-dependent oxidoreductase n=1 Tax=Paenibacillus roseopurpureus TaxID=2918901 RepID=A0AA96LLZ0_9BACL|nr:FAD-dependent oxidoreductase [Paenibacillus sp. MBLB1832]WNR43424.1 FAD-dependent oxidoreductase [Paenibacillus sp. MBLB1832]
MWNFRVASRTKWTALASLLILISAAGGVLAYFGLYRDSDGGFTLHTRSMYQPDVVVIGTELEGMYLAQKAKKEGLDVLILETKGKLGGQLIQGEMLYLDGTYDDEGKPLMQGGMKELFDQYTKGSIRKKAQFAHYFHGLIEGIPIEKNVILSDVQVSDGKVVSFTYANESGEKRKVEPSYVVDNSEDAALIRQLGVQPLPGLESLYGGKDREYMSGTYMMKLKGIDWDTFSKHFWSLDLNERAHLYGPESYMDAHIAYGFPPIVAAYSLHNKSELNLRGLNILNQGDGEIIINALQVYGIDPSRQETITKGLQEAKEEMPYILEHLRQNLKGFEHAELNGEPNDLYVREYNHYPTDYVLQVSDLMSGRMFWDNVSIGGYFLDIQGSRSNREGLAIGRPDKYGIPLRSYLLKDYENVVTTGKLVGATAIAYGSARIQPNGAMAGESIGVLMGELRGRSLKSTTAEEMAKLHHRMEVKYHIKLSNQTANNKIEHLSEAEKSELDRGIITLLKGNTVAHHLPFIHINVEGRALAFKGIKPIAIGGIPWVPIRQTFELLGYEDAQYDEVNKLIQYSAQGKKGNIPTSNVKVLNNFELVSLEELGHALGFRWAWNDARDEVSITRL